MRLNARLKKLEQAGSGGSGEFVILIDDEPLLEGVRPEDVIDIGGDGSDERRVEPRRGTS